MKVNRSTQPNRTAPSSIRLSVNHETIHAMVEVLGTVVGVVSLVIQVSSAISAYIEGVQCRKEEVESTIRYRRSFQLLLTQIGTLKDNLPTSSVPSTIALDGALKAAGAQILQLDSFMGKVLVQDSSSSSETPASHKFRDQKKKLFYPFRKDQLISLDKRLQAINIALQSAMQVMELYETCGQLTLSLLTQHREISMATQVSVRQIHEETSMANTMLLNIKTDFARSIEQNRSHDLAIQNDMDELKSTVEAPASSNSDTMLAIHVLGQAFNERKWSGRNSHSLMRRAIKTIQASFSSRTSSPFDMDSNGRTLLHDVLMIQVNTNSEMPRNEILKFLAMAGVPRDRPDRRGV